MIRSQVDPSCLANHRLDDLIAHIRRRSPDAIVIADLPPVNSTDEALKVIPRLDAMFMVVSESKTAVTRSRAA